MKAAAARSPRQRRVRVSRDRYRAAARVSGVRARLPRSIRALDIATLVLAALFILVATPRVAGALGSGAADFETRLGEIFPALQGSKPIDLPTASGTVNTQLAADNLPDFTRDPALKVSGRVPAFAMAAGRVVEVTLNGAVAATATPDAGGAYTAALTLREGPNAITLRLLSGTDVVADSSYTVVLDRVPPAVAITKPKSGDTLDGPNVVVEGKAEAGATVTLNDRTIVPAQDGSFSESVPASPGALTITVVARDRAGNESTVRTPVTVKPAASAGPLAVLVILDKVKVTPNQVVTADILVTSSGVLKADELVTLSVGVVTIGSARTDATGRARITFTAPPNEGDVAVVVLANGAAGRATLTVAK